MSPHQYSKPVVRTMRGGELVERLGPVSAGSGIRNDFDSLSDDGSGKSGSSS